MVIVFRTVERILGVWREGGLNGRGLAESHGDTLRGSWGTGGVARRRRVYWRTAKRDKTPP
jgi:hypothetical protein